MIIQTLHSAENTLIFLCCKKKKKRSEGRRNKMFIDEQNTRLYNIFVGFLLKRSRGQNLTYESRHHISPYSFNHHCLVDGHFLN